MVKHPAHVWLVDAHPKRHSGCEDEHVAGHPRLLNGLPLAGGSLRVIEVDQASVLRHRAPPLCEQLLPQVPLHALWCQTIRFISSAIKPCMSNLDLQILGFKLGLAPQPGGTPPRNSNWTQKLDL
jgi:hypothetical protein